MKKYKIILTVLLVLLVIAAGVVVSGVLDVREIKSRPEDPSANAAPTQDLKDTYKTVSDINLPLLKTDFENVLYTMSKEGEVTFYSVANGVFTPVPETGSFDVTAECSSQELPATIHYLEQDGKTFGCGLFTNLLHPEVMLYDYAFFKVTEMFPAFNPNGNRLLLMLDVDSSRFWKDEKIFSEIFYLYEDHTTEHFLSEDQRQVGLDARTKTDYKMFTSDILDQGDAENVLFFSSRYYVAYEESHLADIFTSGAVGTVNEDNLRYVKDIATLHFWRRGDLTYYFAYNEDGTFSLYVYDDSTDGTENLSTFTGNIDEDYIIQGSYIFSKSTGEVFNVIDRTSKTVLYSCFKEGFRPDMFAISANGKYCVIRGVDDSGKLSVGIMNFDTNTIVAHTDNTFAYLAGIRVLNDGTVILSAATGESATSYYQLVASAK